MYYDNKDYETTWPEVDYTNKYIQLCETIKEDLPEKDLLFIQSYFHLGMSEKEIAPLLDFSSQSSVSDFKDRVFARINMYVHKKLTFVPRCITDTLQYENKALFDFYKILQRTDTINKITEDIQYRNLFKDYINQLIDYLNIVPCNSSCGSFSLCCNKCQKTENKFINKILGIEDHTLINNLKTQIKLLQYLLNWRVFSASC